MTITVADTAEVVPLSGPEADVARLSAENPEFFVSLARHPSRSGVRIRRTWLVGSRAASR
jgi:hypothetical protein